MADGKKRVLVVTFDALRPDMVTSELMPNLSAFADQGGRFTHNRSTFPTETRVNQTALVTGCYPSRHGIVGNRFWEPIASPEKLFNTGDEDQLSEGIRRLEGRLTDVPVLGEILAEHGKSLAVISSGTPGGTRMLHHKAEELDGFRLSLRRPDTSVPADLSKRLAPIPPHTVPSFDWLTYATDTYLNVVEAERKPDVAILWYCEPDNSYHALGPGAPENLAAIRYADAEFGRVLAALKGEDINIITLSDHGQLGIPEEAIDLPAKLSAAGFPAGEALTEGIDIVVALSSAGGLYVRDSNLDMIRYVVEWLLKQPWCGPLFTREGAVPGTLDLADVGLDHRRAPDIGLVLRSSDSANAHGILGTTVHNSIYPPGGGIHGGLHAKELHSWLAVGGTAFRKAYISDTPTGIIDILPTMLHVLGVKAPPVDGRVLVEALVNGGDAPETKSEALSSETANGHQTQLEISHVAETRYLEWGKLN
jgi:arylsulfatase A-like enzyme